MAAPITPCLFPSVKDRARMIAAVASVAAGAGTAVATITIPNDYPAISTNIKHPIIAILLLQADATLLASGNEFMHIGQMMGAAPDSAKEFQITGLRTINFYQTPAELQSALIFYIADGSGQKT